MYVQCLLLLTCTYKLFCIKISPAAFTLLQVSFVGEGAIDCGGPRREFFRLVALEAKDRFFTGGLKKFFLCDMMAIQVNYLMHFRKL